MLNAYAYTLYYPKRHPLSVIRLLITWSREESICVCWFSRRPLWRKMPRRTLFGNPAFVVSTREPFPKSKRPDPHALDLILCISRHMLRSFRECLLILFLNSWCGLACLRYTCSKSLPSVRQWEVLLRWGSWTLLSRQLVRRWLGVCGWIDRWILHEYSWYS